MTKRNNGSTRRGFLKGMAAATGVAALPTIWIPRPAFAAQTAARGTLSHIIYIRLSGGFRFSAVYNGDVAAKFNPFGVSRSIPTRVEWGPSALCDQAPWLDGAMGTTRKTLGMKSVTEISRDMSLLPCVDHEPDAGSADGNHGSSLERFLTGYVGGPTSFLTMVNYGLRQQVATAVANGETPLPAISFGDTGMSRGFGEHAAYRPPVVQGDGFERFGFDPNASLPAWARGVPEGMDSRLRDRLHPKLRGQVDSYIQSREATSRYAAIFGDPTLKVSQGTDVVVDGISNRQLIDLLGDSGTGRSAALALRLFHFGCPAVYMNQGGYDLHSDEETRLPMEIAEVNQLLSGLNAALRRMTHPAGGTYWDRTLVVLGSEMGRTTGGSRFNSARGSDHGGDLATRWMSMPMMGGIVETGGIGGRTFGRTRAADLVAQDKVYSYRSMLKTMLNLLGADHSTFFSE